MSIDTSQKRNHALEKLFRIKGGSSLLLIEEIPAGTYRLYVKNPETFNALSADESAESVNATGALVYSLVPR